jgi:hypothetical protein
MFGGSYCSPSSGNSNDFRQDCDPPLCVGSERPQEDLIHPRLHRKHKTETISARILIKTLSSNRNARLDNQLRIIIILISESEQR